jgi:hypothetical protein
MHGPRGRIRSLPYLIVLACSIDRSTLLRFFVSEVPRIFIARGGGVTRSRPASAARPPMGGSNRHCSGTKLFYCIIYKVYFISKYASGTIFFFCTRSRPMISVPFTLYLMICWSTLGFGLDGSASCFWNLDMPVRGGICCLHAE